MRKYLALVLALLALVPVSASAAQLPKTRGICEVEALPEHWDPVRQPQGSAQLILDLTADTLYRISPEGTILPGLARELPQDVTGEYAGSFGIPETARRGYAFAVALSDTALWEDGTAISAGDVLLTLEKMLENGSFSLEIANYDGYVQGRKLPEAPIVSLMEAGFSSIREARDAGFEEFYIDVEHFWGLEEGWKPVSDRNAMLDSAIPSGVDEMYVSPAYLFDTYLGEGGSQTMFQSEFVGVAAGEGTAITREAVGLVRRDARSFVLIVSQPATSGVAAAALCSVVPVPEQHYCDVYATSRQTYSACGAYRIASVSADTIVLEPNPSCPGSRETLDSLVLREIGS